MQLADQAVRAYGQDVALKPGLTLEADVPQESRKAWEWVLEPVLAMREQVRVLGSNSAAKGNAANAADKSGGYPKSPTAYTPVDATDNLYGKRLRHRRL